MKDIFESYFELNLNEYSNIGIDLEINKVLLALFVALCVSFFVIHFHRRTMYLIIRQMLRHGAVGEDNAMTLSDLGIDRTFGVRYLILHSSELKRIVRIKGEKEYTYEEYMALSKRERARGRRVDFATAELYVDTDMRDRATKISDSYNSTVVKTLLLCAFAMIVYLVIMVLMPELLAFIDSSVIGAE